MGQMDQPVLEHEARLVLAREPESVVAARQFVCQLVADPDLAELARLLVSELSTNAVVHAAGESFEVRVRSFDSCVRIEVFDESTTVPVALEPDPWRVGGRGLVLVDTLANRWGVDRQPDGKTVWFELTAGAAEEVS
jgi:anti-sigma regulatory factor (Ser/Thr protein kinase)